MNEILGIIWNRVSIIERNSGKELDFIIEVWGNGVIIREPNKEPLIHMYTVGTVYFGDVVIDSHMIEAINSTMKRIVKYTKEK